MHEVENGRGNTQTNQTKPNLVESPTIRSAGAHRHVNLRRWSYAQPTVNIQPRHSSVSACIAESTMQEMCHANKKSSAEFNYAGQLSLLVSVVATCQKTVNAPDKQ